MIGNKQVGPFVGVDFDKVVSHDKRSFRIITYQAYNSRGLIGSENNGVAILDEDNSEVIVDNIAATTSGYYGVTPEQNEEAERISTLDWESLVELVNSSDRARTVLGKYSKFFTQEVKMRPWTVIRHSSSRGYSCRHLTGPVDTSSALPFFRERAAEDGYTVVAILAGTHEAHVVSDEAERQD